MHCADVTRWLTEFSCLSHTNWNVRRTYTELTQMKQETQNQHHLTAPTRSVSVWWQLLVTEWRCFDDINCVDFQSVWWLSVLTTLTVHSTTTCDDKMASVIDDSYWPWSQCFDYINSLATESVFDDSYWFDSSESLVWKSSYCLVCVSVCIMVCMKLKCLCNIM